MYVSTLLLLDDDVVCAGVIAATSDSVSETSESSRSLHSIGSKPSPNASPTTPFARSGVLGAWNRKPAMRSSTFSFSVAALFAASCRPLDFQAGSGGYSQSFRILSRSNRRASRSCACCSALRWCEPGRFRCNVIFLSFFLLCFPLSLSPDVVCECSRYVYGGGWGCSPAVNSK